MRQADETAILGDGCAAVAVVRSGLDFREKELSRTEAGTATHTRTRQDGCDDLEGRVIGPNARTTSWCMRVVGSSHCYPTAVV